MYRQTRYICRRGCTGGLGVKGGGALFFMNYTISDDTIRRAILAVLSSEYTCEFALIQARIDPYNVLGHLVNNVVFNVVSERQVIWTVDHRFKLP